jgi:DNA-binding CsgD family transcriptional regulator
MLTQAVGDLRTGEFPAEERLECSLLTYRSAVDLWDDESWYALATRNVAAARAAGDLTALQFALNARICADAFMGEMTAGFLLLAEMEAVCEATDSHLPPYAPLALAAWRGREAEVSLLAESTTEEVRERGEGMGLSAAQWALAVLYNNLGRHEEALAAAQRAGDYQDPGFSDWSLAELVLAAVRCGQPGNAADARAQLRTASQMLGAMGLEGMAERAHAELRLAGGADREPIVPAGEVLTQQETQVARLASDGLSNHEIGARLFISTRTVQYHLGKVFTKLGISSRSQLYRALPDALA